jgi:cytochrome c peroxidase
LDSSISCGSCHIPGSAFSDTVAFSQGILNKHAKRNSPSLMNIGFNPSFMAEGGVKSLELQVLAPIENDDEMGMTIGAVCDRLNTDEYYRKAFRLIWDTAATPYTVTRSIAAFERTLIGGNSKYDRFANGDSSTFTSDERNGFILFNTERFNCSSCHSGRLFTNNSIENNGLYVSYTDNGLFRLSLKQGDMGKFKVPTLRNIALTAPYMHDGSMRRLEDVIDHYDNGGANHANKSEFIKPIHMTDDERKSLIAFLKTLTEES